jgi:hypothetical protein
MIAAFMSYVLGTGEADVMEVRFLGQATPGGGGRDPVKTLHKKLDAGEPGPHR